MLSFFAYVLFLYVKFLHKKKNKKQKQPQQKQPQLLYYYSDHSVLNTEQILKVSNHWYKLYLGV